MKKHILISFLYTMVMALILGVAYPVLVTCIARLAFRDKASGQLIVENGTLVGSRLIGQPFTGPGFFHSRPSAAGAGYDAASSSGSNLAPTNKALVDRVAASVAVEDGGSAVPIDLVTASASGLDPDVSPAAALYQVPRVARERKIDEAALRNLVMNHIVQRQFGLFGEPRVNVLELNMALSAVDKPSSIAPAL